MGRAPCCDKVGLKRGRWTAKEDGTLTKYIARHGEGSWRSLPKNAGLLRCGKSCRLRWVNYLKEGVRRGNFSKEEDHLIVKLHATFGNRWSLIASHLPGRTDNEIKNYWNAHLSRRTHSVPYTAGKETTITVDNNKLSVASKRRGGRAPRSSTKKQPVPEPVRAISSSTSSLPPGNSDQNQPINNITDDMTCSKEAMVMDTVELNGGVLEPNYANNSMDQIAILVDEREIEALLSSINDTSASGLTAIEHGSHSPQVEDTLDMDWEGFASCLWDQPTQNDLLETAEPQAMMGSESDKLESFVSWLLSDAC